jgi:hypothetical protein
MRSKLPVILFFAFVCIPPIGADAAKLPDLATITSAEGIDYFFDPAKVTAVRLMPFTQDEGRRGVSQPRSRPLTTHVFGIAGAPIPINKTPEQFLQDLHIESKFVTLTITPTIKLFIKATAVTAVTKPPPRGYNSDVRSLLYPAQNMGITIAATPWQVLEPPDEVKNRINEIRRKQDSPEGLSD